MPKRIPTHKPYEAPRQRTQHQHDSEKFLNSWAWRRLSKLKLARDPLCECSFGPEGQSCGRFATEVHHIIDRAERPDLALVWSNLQSLHKSCHSRITNERIVRE